MLRRFLDPGLLLAVAVTLGAAACGANPVLPSVTQDTSNNADVKTTVVKLKVEGIVSGLTGTCPAITFTVKTLTGNGTTVTTTAQTVYENIWCASLRDGMKLQIDGLWQPNGTVSAVDVKYDPK